MEGAKKVLISMFSFTLLFFITMLVVEMFWGSTFGIENETSPPVSADFIFFSID